MAKELTSWPKSISVAANTMKMERLRLRMPAARYIESSLIVALGVFLR
jgi:hypothetical protein